MKFDRSEAVATAMNTFRKKGYQATSVSDLAAAMSITRSSFYNSFKSRDRLFEEAMTLYMADAPDHLLKQPIPVGRTSVAIRTFFNNICNNLDNAPEHNGCLIINSLVVANESAPPPEGVQRFMTEKRAEFEHVVAQAVSDKTIAPVKDVGVTAEAIIAFMIGLNMIGRTGFPKGHLWNIAQAYLDSLGFTENLTNPTAVH